MKCTECLTEHELERCPACNHRAPQRPAKALEVVGEADVALEYLRGFYARFRGSGARCDVAGCGAVCPDATGGAFTGGHWVSSHWHEHHPKRYDEHQRRINPELHRRNKQAKSA